MLKKLVLSTLMLSLTAPMLGMEMTSNVLGSKPEVEPASLKAQIVAGIVQKYLHDATNESSKNNFLILSNLDAFQDEVSLLVKTVKGLEIVQSELSASAIFIWIKAALRSQEEIQTSIQAWLPCLQRALTNPLVLEALPYLITVNNRNRIQNYLLFLALANRNFEAASLLLSRGSSVDAHIAYTSKKRCSLAEWAVEINDAEILEFLLANGANPNDTCLQDRDGVRVPLLYRAVERNNPSLVRALVEYGADSKLCTLGMSNVLQPCSNPLLIQWCPLGLAVKHYNATYNENFDRESRKQILQLLLQATEFSIQEKMKFLKFVHDRVSEETLEIITKHLKQLA